VEKDKEMIMTWLVLTFAIWLLTKGLGVEKVVPIAVVKKEVDPLIEHVAKKYGHDPDLIHAFVIVESSYQLDVVGDVGEIGLMQISPICLKEFNNVTKRGFTEWDLHVAERNLEVGCWYLRRLQDHYKLTLAQAVRAYNCGLSDFNRAICYRYGDRINSALEELRGV